MKYKMSIIVTVYNLEKYVERCLESLVNQTLKDIEIIVVNDGSTDNSQKIIDKYAKKYFNIKSYIKENSGGDWGARNYGLNKVTTNYFIFVDCDDYVYPDYAKKLYEAIINNDADMSVCAFERINSLTNKTVGIDMNNYGYKTFEVNPNDNFVAFVNPGPCNKIYKKSVIQNNKFKAIRGSSDLIFMLDNLPNIKKITLIDDVLYSYQMRYDSQITCIKKEDIETFKNEFLRIRDKYLKNNAEFIEFLNSMAFIHIGISLVYRVSYNNNAKQEIKQIIKFLDDNFPWRHNKFLKINWTYKRGIKQIALSIIVFLYKIKLSYFFIRLYRFFIDKLKIEIKY